MGNVIRLKGPQLRPRRVEITNGIVTRTTTHDQAGVRVLEYIGGKQRFFVDLVEPDGGRLGLWDGLSYPDAIRSGLESARDFGVPCDDLVGC